MGTTTFLDKTCIHQTNQVLKRQGIRHLADFLENSNRLLVVYTDEYLKRVWTVYELASFLLIKLKDRRVDIIPTFYAQFILGCCIAYWALLALYDAANSKENL